MKLNPITLFIRRYHSADLKPSELRKMLNLWLPFIFNRIKICHISEDFRKIDVILKHSIWNRNPSRGLWGGSIFSAIDPFYPIMLKQNAIRRGYKTDFFTKSTEVKFIKEAKSDLRFKFCLTKEEIESAISVLLDKEEYEGWHSVEGIDKNGVVCTQARIQTYLRLRN